MTLKSRINKLEKDNAPKKPPVKIVLDWGESPGPETPEEKAARIAARPTHDEDGNPITYIDWPEDLPDDDEGRIRWANDVLGAAQKEDD